MVDDKRSDSGEAYQRQNEDNAAVNHHVFKLVDHESPECQCCMVIDFETFGIVRHGLFPTLRYSRIEPVEQRICETYYIRCKEGCHYGDSDDDRVEELINDLEAQA